VSILSEVSSGEFWVDFSSGEFWVDFSYGEWRLEISSVGELLGSLV